MNRRNVLFSYLIPAAILASASTAYAFVVLTADSDACHEQFAGRAFRTTLENLPDISVPLPKDDDWKDISKYLAESFEVDRSGLNDAEEFMLFSLLLGARHPDTGGQSALNLDSIRMIHANDEDEGQYIHFTRGPKDDYDAGSEAAAAGGRLMVAELTERAIEIAESTEDDQMMTTDVYLDFYGMVEVKVWAPMFIWGLASHVLADSFSHTIRDEADGFHTILHVMNYVDAISDDFDEKRDGLAHSGNFDQCNEQDIAPLRKAVDAALGDFFNAIGDRLSGANSAAIDEFIDLWLGYRGGCNFKNDMCENGRWVKTARKDPTGPYLGCSQSIAVSGDLSAFLFLILLGIALRMRRQKRAGQKY